MLDTLVVSLELAKCLGYLSEKFSFLSKNVHLLITLIAHCPRQSLDLSGSLTYCNSMNQF